MFLLVEWQSVINSSVYGSFLSRFGVIYIRICFRFLFKRNWAPMGSNCPSQTICNVQGWKVLSCNVAHFTGTFIISYSGRYVLFIFLIKLHCAPYTLGENFLTFVDTYYSAAVQFWQLNKIVTSSSMTWNAIKKSQLHDTLFVVDTKAPTLEDTCW